MSKCHKCGLIFTEEDLENASKGEISPVGDWDWVCYPCQIKMLNEGTWEEWKAEMLELHNKSGKCNHE